MKRKKKTRKLALDILMVNLIFFGVLTMLYPLASDSINSFINQQQIAYFQKKANLESSEKLKEMKTHNEQLKNQTNIAVMDPFENTSSDEPVNYQDYLIGSIVIPAIKVNIPIYDRTNEILLQNGATLLNGTSFPLGGENTHSVISAHSGLPDKLFFTNLSKLEEGDIFIVNAMDKKLAYEVDKIQTVEPTDLSWLKIEKERDLVTLMTCTPYMINSHRLLVTGHRIPYQAKMEKAVNKVNTDNQIKLAIIGLFILILLIIFILVMKKIITRWKKLKS